MALMRWRPWGLQRREPRGMTEWDPWGEFRRMKEEMDRLFEGFLPDTNPATRDQEAVYAPAVDVYETENEVVVKAELPGIPKDRIQVDATSDAIVLQAEHKDEQETKEDGYYRRERRYGRFYRTIPLPEGVKAEEAKGSFQDGVLEIHLPKSEEAKKKNVKVKIQ